MHLVKILRISIILLTENYIYIMNYEHGLKYG